MRAIMKMRSILLSAAAILAIAPLGCRHAKPPEPKPVVTTPPPAETQPPAPPPERKNPFFEESTLPFKYPQFDQIKDTDFAPAFDRGMADQLQEVAGIATN